jgi:hypothetical protein
MTSPLIRFAKSLLLVTLTLQVIELLSLMDESLRRHDIPGVAAAVRLHAIVTPA